MINGDVKETALNWKFVIFKLSADSSIKKLCWIIENCSENELVKQLIRYTSTSFVVNKLINYLIDLLNGLMKQKGTKWNEKQWTPTTVK